MFRFLLYFIRPRSLPCSEIWGGIKRIYKLHGLIEFEAGVVSGLPNSLLCDGGQQIVMDSLSGSSIQEVKKTAGIQNGRCVGYIKKAGTKTNPASEPVNLSKNWNITRCYKVQGGGVRMTKFCWVFFRRENGKKNLKSKWVRRKLWRFSLNLGAKGRKLLKYFGIKNKIVKILTKKVRLLKLFMQGFSYTNIIVPPDISQLF